jgi:glutathione-regulated potassium-efflux system ancillary protein KefC/glutathione-regulated potassium-efflux system protein KefB
MAGAAPSLLEPFVFLTAAVAAVPVAKRLGLGSVLGYLIAGAIIGPHALGFLKDAEGVMHVSEFGVVIMLFLIGLELQPSVLWRMRGAILGLGGAQVLATGGVIAAIALAFGMSWQMALAVGLTLSLSSTAIVMQSLRERGQSNTEAGRGAFGVLLMQDIAIIPMLALFPLLATMAIAGGQTKGFLAELPAWAQGLAVAAAVAIIVFGGRLVLRPIFRWVAQSGLQEMFTALALALVVGVALLMQTVGLSPALGAFIAGVVLAESEFRHEIETDIEPFRGLLLGLFFIAVGASIDFALILREPLLILGLTLGLIAVKASVMFAVASLFKKAHPDKILISLGLAQGGEFAFVLFAFAQGAGVLPQHIVDPLVAVVALSMAATPLLFMLAERLAAPAKADAPQRAPEIENHGPQVIIAGYGRFGQIAGRMLGAAGYRISVLEHDADQVELLRGFGRRVNYGDATRLDLLRLAGAAEAQLFIIAIDDKDKALELAKLVREHFPNLKVAARAYDRRHAYELMASGVDAIERETFEGGVRMGVKALRLLGAYPHHAERAGRLFRRYDERTLEEMAKHWEKDFPEYQRIVRDRTALEEELLRRDVAAFRQETALDDNGWDTRSLDAEVAAKANKAS